MHLVWWRSGVWDGAQNSHSPNPGPAHLHRGARARVTTGQSRHLVGSGRAPPADKGTHPRPTAPRAHRAGPQRSQSAEELAPGR
jgi:hypothetical protein